MDFYGPLINGYNQVLAIFPPGLRWVVTLIILIGLVGGLISLVRRNVLFVLLAVLLLPLLIPVIGSFLNDLYTFVLFLLGQLESTAPRPAP